jgi:hypothetical protein
MTALSEKQRAANTEGKSKQRLPEHQENMNFFWGGRRIGHATIKVKTHQHRQKDNHKVKR